MCLLVHTVSPQGDIQYPSVSDIRTQQSHHVLWTSGATRIHFHSRHRTPPFRSYVRSYIWSCSSSSRPTMKLFAPLLCHYRSVCPCVYVFACPYLRLVLINVWAPSWFNILKTQATKWSYMVLHINEYNTHYAPAESSKQMAMFNWN